MITTTYASSTYIGGIFVIYKKFTSKKRGILTFIANTIDKNRKGGIIPMDRILFLDYDGVINRRMWKRIAGCWVCSYNFPEDNSVNDLQAVQWVSAFCEKYNYKIVVSSTWGLYSNYAECLYHSGLRNGIEILGTIAKSNFSKNEEIRQYINSHDDIEMYLIFDDDPSLLCFGEHMVLCNADYGFGEIEYKKAETLHKNNNTSTKQ